MLTVTGPTVACPLLRHIRPSGKISSIDCWEGIVIDPIGAVLAVPMFEVFDVVQDAHFREGLAEGLIELLKTALTGAVFGSLAAWFLTQCLKRYWIPERLQSPTALMLVVGIFVASHLIQHESGLLSVTVMGVILANQKSAFIKHIFEFKENLSVLLISSLFILLSAQVAFSELIGPGWHGIAFVAVIILIARPVSVLISTLGTDLSGSPRTLPVSGNTHCDGPDRGVRLRRIPRPLWEFRSPPVSCQ